MKYSSFGLILVLFFSVSNSYAEEIKFEEKPTEINVYAGTFDVIDKEGDDYKICSPFDESIGWINKKQVSFTFYQNPQTQKPCN